MFNIKHVSKQYHGDVVLHDVSMTIGKGLTFLVGASGSGKTTLLQLMSGMDQDFDGEISYGEQSIKALTDREKSRCYRSIFGFVWQDFNLLEHSTVLENVCLPTYLQDDQNKKQVEKIVKDLNLKDIASQKVNTLSGGQKQRVAIARELMKNPEVIFADEPTSALDETTAKATMNMLRMIAKHKTVIVVTHDTSLIEKQDRVFELDKGELITKPEAKESKETKLILHPMKKLPLKHALSITKTNLKNALGRWLISSLTLLVASVLLLTTMSGAIHNSSQGEFDQLLDTYGDALCDISVINSFMNASGNDGSDQKKPNGNVTQDIRGLYSLYAKDERVSFITYLQAFDSINIQVDGKTYQVKSSGNAPVINELIAGNMPMGDGHEVIVPESFVKRMGLTPQQAIGKELEFKGSIYDWSSGNPVSKNTSTTAKIVGVMDTTVKYEYEGTVMSYPVDDSFFFSKSALDELLTKVGKSIDELNFMMRANTPANMIEIKDELNAKGIVPLGRFELVEDMVRLSDQSLQQSGLASTVIGLLSIVMVIAIFMMTATLRKKEVAIYKVTGFTMMDLRSISFVEMSAYAMSAIGILFITSPLINQITTNLFHVTILDPKMLIIGMVLIVLTSMIAWLITIFIAQKVKVRTVLKSGDLA